MSKKSQYFIPCVIIWALVVAQCIAFLTEFKWWHPSCLDDGGYYGWGFPFPNSKSGATSMTFTFVPHIYVLNVVLIAVVLSPLIYFILRKLHSPVFIKVGVGVLIMQIVIILYAMTFMLFPRLKLNAEPDSYWDYRPVILIKDGPNRCIS